MRTWYAYCDDNPVSRADISGKAWAVVALGIAVWLALTTLGTVFFDHGYKHIANNRAGQDGVNMAANLMCGLVGVAATAACVAIMAACFMTAGLGIGLAIVLCVAVVAVALALDYALGEATAGWDNHFSLEKS